jgi:hypothetical protein
MGSPAVHTAGRLFVMPEAAGFADIRIGTKYGSFQGDDADTQPRRFPAVGVAVINHLHELQA